MELIAGENDNNRRLDRVLRKALPSSPLALLHRLLRQGKVHVNGKSAKAEKRIVCGDKIYIPLNENAGIPVINNSDTNPVHDSVQTALKSSAQIKKQLPSALDILWQNENLLAVNKPSGLCVHGRNSLDTMIGSFLSGSIPPSLSFKSGPLHRLDTGSSGIIVFSKTLEGARLFSSLLQERKVRKSYLFIAEGNVNKEEIWEDCLARDKEKKKTFVSESGRKAVTKIKSLSVSSGFSLVTAEISTGRTHQIRAQAAFHGHPLAGDRKYGSKRKGCFFLHAWKMEFLNLKIEAPLPPDFLNEIIKLKLSEGINL